MRTPAKLAAFAAGIGLPFAGGVVAGDLLGADDPTPPPAHGRTHEVRKDGGPAQPVRGLAVAEDGLQIVVDEPELLPGRTQNLRYRVVDDGGRTIRDFDVEHEKRMHLVLVRRDLTGFQHLHPEQERDGSWAGPLRLDDPGSYRLLADFTRDGKPYTLASDLRVDGESDLEALPAPTDLEMTDGYAVRLQAGRARPGVETQLRYTVTKAGRPVETEPYLGAGGHLVALREGDLGFLHVHPSEPGHAGHTATGGDDENAVSFTTTLPTRGQYRLFLQFKHQGRVRTVAFTKEVK